MKTGSLVVLVMLCAAPAAEAQQTDANQTPTSQEAQPIAGIDQAGLARSARASKLIGSKVYKGDASVGQLDDVLVDLDRGSVTAVILSVGGFLGIGDKRVAVPLDSVKVSSEARFTTELTKEQLASAPAFDHGEQK